MSEQEQTNADRAHVDAIAIVEQKATNGRKAHDDAGKQLKISVSQSNVTHVLLLCIGGLIAFVLWWGKDVVADVKTTHDVVLTHSVVMTNMVDRLERVESRLERVESRLERVESRLPSTHSTNNLTVLRNP